MDLHRLLIPPKEVIDAWDYFPNGLNASAGLARPLGRAFEQVVRAAVEAHPDLVMVAEHVLIWGVDALGKRQSVGELDFVVWDANRQRLMHWEVAFKYYVGQVQAVTLPDGRVSHWPGPKFQDCLERKWDKLTTHQLKLSQRYPDAVRLALQLAIQKRTHVQKRAHVVGDALATGVDVWCQAPILPAMLVAGFMVYPEPAATATADFAVLPAIALPSFVDSEHVRLTGAPCFD